MCKKDVNVYYIEKGKDIIVPTVPTSNKVQESDALTLNCN